MNKNKKDSNSNSSNLYTADSDSNLSDDGDNDDDRLNRAWERRLGIRTRRPHLGGANISLRAKAKTKVNRKNRDADAMMMDDSILCNSGGSNSTRGNLLDDLQEEEEPQVQEQDHAPVAGKAPQRQEEEEQVQVLGQALEQVQLEVPKPNEERDQKSEQNGAGDQGQYH